jgi:hypothetical protein
VQVTLAVLADYANVSREGKLNIMGIFGQVRAARVPAQHPAMKLVVRIEGAPAELDREHKIEIRCMEPDGDDVFKIEGEFTLQRPPGAGGGAAIAADHIVGINNLTFRTFGGHTFSVFIDNDLKAQVPLELVKVEPRPPMLPGT